ncbi:hypothetical protein HWV62_21706 [Athelia sp. TMB]|nr:hypothetical protein HWV62_21706 [Athelia sp. TMB]
MEFLPDIRSDASTHTKHICIVGAGAAGLSALKTIMDTAEYKTGVWAPVVYEAREDIGGVWLPAPPTGDPPATPLYDSLTTNLPHPVMAYTSFSFPPSTPLFPPASTVLTYLKSYAAHFHLTQHIRLNTSVKDLRWDPVSNKWKAELSNAPDKLDYDYIIVGNGHYNLPRYPEMPGLSKWLEEGKAIHSAWYRHPHNLGNTVLVLGGGPSGQDISSEMLDSARTVIHSIPGTSADDEGRLKHRGRLIELTEDGHAVFEDGRRDPVDFVILATGYKTSFPFLESSALPIQFPQPVPPLPREAYNSEYHVFPLAKHLFPIQSAFPPTSIAFVGLQKRVAPLPLLEAQARAVLRVFADPGALDPTREAVDIVTRYEELKAVCGDSPLAIAKAWHTTPDAEQFDYRNEMYAFAGGEPQVVVTDWEREMYAEKGVLRAAWRELERTGHADEWVKGVGEGGIEEWVDMMRRLIKHAEKPGQQGSEELSKL